MKKSKIDLTKLTDKELFGEAQRRRKIGEKLQQWENVATEAREWKQRADELEAELKKLGYDVRGGNAK